MSKSEDLRTLDRLITDKQRELQADERNRRKTVYRDKLLSTVAPQTTSKPFIQIGERVRILGRSRYRYDTWPKDKWLEAGVAGTVVEYHSESPAVRIKGELFEALPPYAVVQWDLGEGAKTAIDIDDEGTRWERIKEVK